MFSVKCSAHGGMERRYFDTRREEQIYLYCRAFQNRGVSPILGIILGNIAKGTDASDLVDISKPESKSKS